jgi:hypothetical protein
MDDQVMVTFSHHKAVKSQQGLMSGPICTHIKRGQLTSKLTLILVKRALPHLYSIMGESAPESMPLPMLFDAWGSAEQGSKFREFNQSSYSTRYQEVCLGSKCFSPDVRGKDVLASLTLAPCPFQPGPFMPSDNRRNFVTSMVEFERHISMAIGNEKELTGFLRGIAAQHIGNKAAMWEKAYDMLLKLREEQVIETIMVVIKEELKKKVKESKVMSLKRRRVETAYLAPSPSPIKEQEEKALPSGPGKKTSWERLSYMVSWVGSKKN